MWLKVMSRLECRVCLNVVLASDTQAILSWHEVAAQGTFGDVAAAVAATRHSWQFTDQQGFAAAVIVPVYNTVIGLRALPLGAVNA